MAVNHKDLSTGNIHIVANWRTASAPTTVAADIGKIWEDTDNNTFNVCTAAGSTAHFKQMTLAVAGTGQASDFTAPNDFTVTNDLNVSGDIKLTGDLLGGKRSLSVYCITGITNVSAPVDGIAYVHIPQMLNGANLTRANAQHVTKGAGGTSTTIDIFRLRDTDADSDTGDETGVDMLSSAITINTGETIGTAGTVDTGNDDVNTDDLLRIDITTMGCSTAPKGLVVSLEFTDPTTT